MILSWDVPPFSCVISAFCACTRPCAGQAWRQIFAALDVLSSVSNTFSRSSPNIFPYLSFRHCSSSGICHIGIHRCAATQPPPFFLSSHLGSSVPVTSKRGTVKESPLLHHLCWPQFPRPLRGSGTLEERLPVPFADVPALWHAAEACQYEAAKLCTDNCTPVNIAPVTWSQSAFVSVFLPYAVRTKTIAWNFCSMY